MKKIDLRDRRILYELDLNSRKSISEISKKIKIAKGSVIHRIKKLEEIGVIKKYYTVIDSFKLGYICLRYLIKLKYASIETKELIVEYFKDYHNTWYLAEPEGKYDLLITLWGKNIREIYNFWNETLKKYSCYFQFWTYSIYVDSYLYHHSYLIDDYDSEDRDKVEIIGYNKQIIIDDLDFEILKILSSNARISMVDLSQQLKSNVKTIKTRINKLTNLKIINGYRVSLDISKIGYKYFEVEMNLRDYNERNKILNYIIQNPNMVMIDNTISSNDIEFEYQLKDIDQLKKIIHDIMNKFPNSIKNYDYFYFPKIDVLNYFPNKL